MIFPIGDDQVRGGHFPYISYAFIALNVLVFLYQLTVPGNLTCEFGFIPNKVAAGEDYFTLLTSAFLHGGWMHLIGNMLFLWVFADNIEATIGSIPFLAFYLLGAFAASLAHTFMGAGMDVAGCCEICQTAFSSGVPCNLSRSDFVLCQGSIPAVGASGAISAVLGAYLVMFPKSKVKVNVFIVMNFRIIALLFLGFWIIQQLISGVGAISATADTSGVAWWAHIGGFVFGVVAGLLFRNMYHKKLKGFPAYKLPDKTTFGFKK